MDCKQEQFKCTNGVFYCLKCGQENPNPYEKQEENPQEKKPVKRRAKKGEDK